MLVFNEIRQSSTNEFSMLLNGYLSNEDIWSCHGYFPDNKQNRKILEEALIEIRKGNSVDLEGIQHINDLLEQLDENLTIPFDEDKDCYGEIEGYDVSFTDKKGKVFDVDIEEE